MPGKLSKDTHLVFSIYLELWSLTVCVYIAGHQFLSGTTVGLEILKEFQTEVSALAKYTLEIMSCYEKSKVNLDKSIDKLHSLSTSVSCLTSRMDQHERSQKEIDSTVDIINQRQADIDDTISTVKEQQTCLFTKASELETSISNLKLVTDRSSATSEALAKRIENIECYRSDQRPNKIFFYPPDRVKYFIGRDEELYQLQEMFINSKSSFKTQVISGLGGAGKTTLAIEYAWLMQLYYRGGVFWFSAENTSALANSVARLAFDTETVGTNTKETLMLTQRWLSSLTLNWLLVVDNADENDLSSDLMDVLMGAWKRNSKGHLLITTRREQSEAIETFKIEPNDCVSLGPLTKQESMCFILRRTGISDENSKKLEHLIEELDGLPLALEQAAAHIKVLNCSFEEYFDRFKKKKLSLLSRKISTAFPVESSRLAVKTTWQLNFDYIVQQSEEEGLGKAAPFVMNIMAFFHADDIPRELINPGDPFIEDEDLKETLEDSLAVKQVINILTRFSLFDNYKDGTLQVHRLVQEVIRENISDKTDKMHIIQYAIRLLHAALARSPNPKDVLKLQPITQEARGMLNLWSKLCTTASVLKSHINDFVQANGYQKELYWTFECCKVFQSVAVFDSVYQRQVEALDTQEQLLLMVSFSNLSHDQIADLTSLTIPLYEQDRVHFQECIASTSADENSGGSNLADPDTLKTNGNRAYHSKDFHSAIQQYTEGLRASQDSELCIKLYLNRSLCHLKIQDYEKALGDADCSINLDPCNWKAHCCRAYAIASLIEKGKLLGNMEATGMASASIAGFYNPRSTTEFKMKIHYPILVYKLIKDSKALQEAYATILQRPFVTLLLQKGSYSIGRLLVPKSLQVVGIEEGVQVHIDGSLHVVRPDRISEIDFTPEDKLYIHFERVQFVKGGGTIIAGPNTMLSFYHCMFSNGTGACEDFPKCKGGKGCNNPNPNECRASYEAATRTSSSGCVRIGVAGKAGVYCEGGNVVLNSCIIDGCGGPGLMCVGTESQMKVTGCTVKNNRQAGLNVRWYGQLFVENTVIENNQLHGVLIGPYAKARLSRNSILRNQHEGLFCFEDPQKNISGNPDSLQPLPLTPRTVVEIESNIISHNGLNGITLDGGTFIVHRNKVFENWLWGILQGNRSSCSLTNNDIFSNKSGGVKYIHTHSGVTYIDGNTIRDHTGPSLQHDLEDYGTLKKLPKEAVQAVSKSSDFPDDELMPYSRRPVITNRNTYLNNDLGIKLSAQEIATDVCSFCHGFSSNLKCCSKCKKAPYCSKACQVKHWSRHKQFCKLVCSKYTVLIKMSDVTRPFSVEGKLSIRTFSPSLKGIGEGPEPNPNSKAKFMVKIQTGLEYSLYDPETELLLYDRSTKLDFSFKNPQLYHLASECGVLGDNKMSTKKIYCWASFDEGGKYLKIFTDNLLPLQSW